MNKMKQNGRYRHAKTKSETERRRKKPNGASVLQKNAVF